MLPPNQIQQPSQQLNSAMPQAAQNMLNAPAQLAPPRLHDVTVVRSNKYAQAKIIGIPPEEFGIARNARTLKDADYAFHRVITTHAKLIGEGFDASIVQKIPSYVGMTNIEEIERNTVDEYQRGGSEDINESTRPIEITEHYCRIDYEGKGKACLYKITTGGTGGNELLLTKDGEVDIEPFDAIPIVSMTPIIQTHRFFGRSIADIVKDIQQVKTALLRGVLDNSYMVNNPRHEVAESMSGDNTLDDLLVARPNGIVRVKQPGAVNALSILPIADKIFPVMEYMDATREWRTGVTRQGQGIDANALQNQSATAVNQAFTAAQARMKLIARIFAETGIRDLFQLLHATIRKHGSQKQTVQLCNKWVEINPRDWKKRNDMTCSVGLGSGDKQAQAAQMMGVMNIQKELVINGATDIVQKKNIYNAAVKFTELTGNKDHEQYFTDPATQPPQPPKPDPEMMKLQMEAQMRSQEMQQKAQLDDRAQQQKAQIETVQAQADIATQDRKTQAEMQLAREKFEMEKQLMLIQAQLKQREMEMDLQHKQQLHEANMQQAQFGMVAAQQSHEQKMAHVKQPKAERPTA